MYFRVQDSGKTTSWEKGEWGDKLLEKVVAYDEDYDFRDPDDPESDQYTLPFDAHTVISMLRSLPKGVKWNPRSEEFEVRDGYSW